MNDVTVNTLSFEEICQMIKEETPFKFARYGDGEIYCMEGRKGTNCDKHEYFPDLGQRLKETLKDPDYYIGIQNLLITHLKDKLIKYLSHLKIYNGDVLHRASIAGKMDEFFKAVQGRYIILVGPPHLAGLFDCVHIVTLPVNCWNKYKKVKADLGFHLMGVKNPLVIFCASMMSGVLIHDFRNVEATMIDCGSVFDPYVGVKSRTYHHKLNVK
jgi:hypothetical protein